MTVAQKGFSKEREWHTEQVQGRWHRAKAELQLAVRGQWTHREVAEEANKASRALLCNKYEPDSHEGSPRGDLESDIWVCI